MAELGYDRSVDAVCDILGPDAGVAAIPTPTFETEAYLERRRSGDPAARRTAARAAAEERRALVVWWIRRMVAAERPLREKLTFLWHDHFATSGEKVKVAELLYQQHATLHQLGSGRFDDLVMAMATDPAMLVWLDGRDNTAEAPNENLARELFELFTLGHAAPGGHHHPAYTEQDVAEAARALTGWRIDRSTGEGLLDARRHDHGSKTVLGTTGALGVAEVVAVATEASGMRTTRRSPALQPARTARRGG